MGLAGNIDPDIILLYPSFVLSIVLSTSYILI